MKSHWTAMSTEPFPPSVPSDAAVQNVLARRVDACGLSSGMVVGITEKGRKRIVACGSADSTGRPVDGETVFEVGSITKLFTALLLADMVCRSEAGLDESVETLLPAGTRVPSHNGQAITLRHLATHTSGLPRLPINLLTESPDPYADYTAERLHAFLAEHELARTPDELGPAAALLVAQREIGGLGFGLPQPEGHVVLQHDGGTGGFRSHAGCVPTWRRGAVVLANASTGACADLGIHLCNPRWALLWQRRPVAVDPACFDRLLGCYRMRPGIVFDVRRAGDRLMVQLTGQAAFRVFPLSE